MTANMKILCTALSKLRVDHVTKRQHTFYKPPRYRPPYWFTPKERVMSEDLLTQENKDFIEEIMQEKLNAQVTLESPLAKVEQQTVQWNPFTRRVGLIARKIGNYPLWSKEGKKFQTTLLQVVDNHVIKYIPPHEFNPMKTKKMLRKENPRLGCLLVGFMVSPHAALPTGTPLFATHFRVGDHIDVRAKTIDRGFQGVMKRWGFSGMPASHGVTKTHRRPGNIGAGGEKARVWPGTKMPGHMGNRWRTLRGVKILRINTKHNILWTLGVAIPGETGTVCYLYDTVLPLKKLKTAPPFPTHLGSDDLPMEYYDESVHPFDSDTILFDEV
ncbi:unnamed protein product, partial [Iphiclides podalirius]